MHGCDAQGLLAGETVAGVAGGVNAMMLPITTCTICGLSALSPEARCKTFDSSADGYGRGEAFAGTSPAQPVLSPWLNSPLNTYVYTDLVSHARPSSLIPVLLWNAVTVLARASEGHSRRFAVLLGSAINQDGRSSGLTAPNGPSQTSLIREVISAAEVSAAAVAFVAVHGTGTPLGDPIEVSALGAALAGARGEPARPAAMGSVKACYGHTEGAAGVTGAYTSFLCHEHQSFWGDSERMPDNTSLLVWCLYCNGKVGQSITQEAKFSFTLRLAIWTGIFMAMKALEQRAHAAVLNCRNLNTYVSAALSDWGKQCALAARVPRQLSPAAAAQTAAAGTSSFGMSGTNAHLLVSVPFTPSAVPAGAAVWNRAR